MPMIRGKKTGKKFGTFFVVNIVTTLVDFVFYTVLARILGNDLLWLVAIISGLSGAVVSFIVNKKITWRSSKPKKFGVYLFFIWNGAKIAVVRPLLTIVYSYLTPIYVFAFSITKAIGLPFDMDFVESTGVFCFVTLSTMIMSYLIYDRLVFGNKKENQE